METDLRGGNIVAAYTYIVAWHLAYTCPPPLIQSQRSLCGPPSCQLHHGCVVHGLHVMSNTK